MAMRALAARVRAPAAAALLPPSGPRASPAALSRSLFAASLLPSSGPRASPSALSRALSAAALQAEHSSTPKKQFSKEMYGHVKYSVEARKKIEVPMRRRSAHPKRTAFRKQHRGRMKGKSYQSSHICFGRYALQALEPAWITSRQIEAGRRAMTRHARHGGKGEKVWVRLFPHKPVTAKPTATRMGRGKGSPNYMVAVVKPGQIVYEMDGVSENVARAAISVAASKIPIQSQFRRLEI